MEELLYAAVPATILAAIVHTLLRRLEHGEDVRGQLTAVGEEYMRRGEHTKPLELSDPD